MRRVYLITILSVFACSVYAQSFEAQQLLLNAAKLTQLKQILTDMKKGYDIISSGYNSVRDLSQGNFNLHQLFLDGLMQVSPTVRKYRRIADIISIQLSIVKEYKAASSRFKQSNLFNAGEIRYLDNVYSNLFKASVKNLDDLATVITAGQLRMSDDERLQTIDRIYDDMQDQRVFLKRFNNNTGVLAIQRARQQQETDRLQKLYDVKP